MTERAEDLTPWFSANTKPLREGHYEVRVGDKQCMALFEDNCWYELGTPESPTRGKELINVSQWRGLALPAAASGGEQTEGALAASQREVLIPGNSPSRS